MFTPAHRFTMASLLKDRMEDRRMRLPEGDRDLRDDLHSITKAITSTGNVRLVHDGQSDGHGDRFWAAALCCNAASDPYQPYAYHSVRGRDATKESALSRRRSENEQGPLTGGFRGFRY